MQIALTAPFDVNAVAILCGQEVADLMVRCTLAPRAHSDEALAQIDAPASVQQLVLGNSTDGDPISAYMWGDDDAPRRVLVYGWTHPDEPAGGLVCRWLVENADDPALAGTRWLVVPCADPISRYSRTWAEGSTLGDFTYGSLRVEHLRREVDFGFPIQGDTLVMPPTRDAGRLCTSKGRCMRPDECGDVCQRLRSVCGPLPESMALVNAINLLRPTLAAGLHNASAAGAYEFWQHDPGTDVLHVQRLLTHACRLPRHLGPAIDPGHALRIGQDDVRQEPTLAEIEASFRRRHKLAPDDRRHFVGHGSFAQYLAMRFPHAQYLVPEAGVFTHEDFADISELAEPAQARIDGERLVGDLHLPWGELCTVTYARTARAVPEHTTAGMLFMNAVELRQRLMDQAHALWLALPDQVRNSDDIASAELRSIGDTWRARLERERERAQDESLCTPATRAEHAEYSWRWALESCHMAGRVVSLAERHGHTSGPLRAMIDATLATLPLREARQNVALSQLVRLLHANGEHL